MPFPVYLPHPHTPVPPSRVASSSGPSSPPPLAAWAVVMDRVVPPLLMLRGTPGPVDTCAEENRAVVLQSR